jgi:hypothetical protein
MHEVFHVVEVGAGGGGQVVRGGCYGLQGQVERVFY